jgi:uncharacterized Zn-finger protein
MKHEETLFVDGREVVLTSALHVRCDGGNGPLGHPLEYMSLERDGEVMCKYCGRRYVHVGHPEADAIRSAGSRPAA